MYRYFGVASSLLVFLAMPAAAVSCRGRRQEKYSPLSHFIFELGEVGVPA
jgi:hypothetical protein